MPSPEEFYTQSSRTLQEEFQTRPLADAVVAAIVTDEIQEEQIGFIASRDYFFLATVSDDGQPTVSYKGGPVGLVHVVDPSKLVFPNYDGNGMFKSMGNARETGQVGLLFIDMETPNRVRVQGKARLVKSSEHLERFPGANMVVEVDVESVFYNCARYIHKHERVAQSPYVPDEKGEQPFPAWKRIDGLQPVLPERDQGRADEEGGTITMDEYGQKLMEGTS